MGNRSITPCFGAPATASAAGRFMRLAPLAMLLAAFALMTALFCGCSSEPEPVTSVTGNGSFQTDDAVITVDTTELTIELVANPNSNYSWMMAVEGDSLTLASDTFEEGASINDDQALNGDGVQTLVFNGTNPGDSVIHLSLEELGNADNVQKSLTLNTTTATEGRISFVELEANN